MITISSKRLNHQGPYSSTILNPFPNKPFVLHVCSTGRLNSWKHCWKRRNCSWWAISPFPTTFSTPLKNFLPFSSYLKLFLQTLSVWKSLKFLIWERVKNVLGLVLQYFFLYLDLEAFESNTTSDWLNQYGLSNQNMWYFQTEKSWRKRKGIQTLVHVDAENFPTTNLLDTGQTALDDPKLIFSYRCTYFSVSRRI